VARARGHRILGKLEHRVRVEGLTQPGDPMRLDYGYQSAVRGFIHSVSLRRDLPQGMARPILLNASTRAMPRPKLRA
jgi:hypothetical protein